MKFNLFYIAAIFSMLSCNKLLDTIPDKQLATTDNLMALEALLNENFAINRSGNGLGEASSDDYYLEQTSFDALSQQERNTYVWEMDNAAKEPYMMMYNKINLANIVLDAIDGVAGDEQSKGEIKGEALFLRANTYFSLALSFAKQYEDRSAKTDLGLILRLNSDFNLKSSRSTVFETYEQIEKDALQAIELLPEMGKHLYKPSKLACFAMLSRFYLAKGDFEKAELFADKFLLIKNDLIDYNTINRTARYPFPIFNAEVVYHTQGSSVGYVFTSMAKTDTLLYDSYSDIDLRKTAFFFKNADGSMRFKGSYVGSIQPFTGYAVDEVLLTKAECLARRGAIGEMRILLNAFLQKRYLTGSSIPVSFEEKEQALDAILLERRKQLLMRDVRWMDLKRLNLEERYRKKIVRKIGDKTYELVPRELRYALSLPQSVIDITGIVQNPR